LLKQNNIEKLDLVFETVSNPKNAQWGQFLSRDEVDEIVKPKKEIFDLFVEWLDNFENVQYTLRADSIRVTTNVLVASKIFQVPFFVYQNDITGKLLTRFEGKASVPSRLAKHIDFIAGLSEFFLTDSETKLASNVATFNSKIKVNPAEKRFFNPQTDLIITPSILKSYYNVPSDLVGSNKSNLQGIAAFEDYFSLGALKSFDSNQNLPFPNITRKGLDCFPSCDQFESDLDVQYITAMGVGIATIFLNQPSNYWILQFAEDTQNMNNPPLVFSVSYGWSELQQCEIASLHCDILGYNSIQYVNRTNGELKKLGAMGVSVLVSDGDDGAPSLGGSSGNCPLDVNHWCPKGGCPHNSSNCGSFQALSQSSGVICFFPMGIQSEGCSKFFNDPNLSSVIQDFISNNFACNINFDVDIENMPHFYSLCPCSLLKPTLSNGWIVGPYVFYQENGPVFVADYPTSSPYVTSVGATQFIQGDHIKEISCSILTGAIITTGGGFSSFQPQPTYQVDTVKRYLVNNANNLPPSFSFDSGMRAYPDISFNGHNYKIFYSNSSSDSCPCLETEVDGTSCSSPAFSGLISLINDKLLNNNKSQLGFLNYLLYQMAAEFPTAFNDIVSGNNNCNRAYCCIYGYSAVPGYDVVSGLGSPNFENMLTYILSKKGLPFSF